MLGYVIAKDLDHFKQMVKDYVKAINERMDKLEKEIAEFKNKFDKSK